MMRLATPKRTRLNFMVVALVAIFSGGCSLLPTASLRVVNDSGSEIFILQAEPAGRPEVNGNLLEENLNPGESILISGITPGVYTLQALGLTSDDAGKAFTVAESEGVLFLPGATRTWTLLEPVKGVGVVGVLSAVE